MKNSLFLGLLCLLLVGCTSEKKDLTEKATALAERSFKEATRKEAEENLKQSEGARQSFIDYMDTHAEIVVDEVLIHSEQKATVQTSVLAYPPVLRFMVLTIAKGLDADKMRRFNFADATSMVAKQKGLPLKKIRQSPEVYKFTKGPRGWSLDP